MELCFVLPALSATLPAEVENAMSASRMDEDQRLKQRHGCSGCNLKSFDGTCVQAAELLVSLQDSQEHRTSSRTNSRPRRVYIHLNG